MKRPPKLAHCILVICIPLFLVSCGTHSSGNAPSTQSGSEITDENTDTGSGASFEDRMNLARKRVALRSIIQKGDYYKARNDAETAIRFYKNADNRIEGDPTLALRLADAYYELKRYSEAYEYYRTLPVRDLNEPTKLRFIGSIMLDKDRKNKLSELAKYPFETGTKEYYSLVDACVTAPEQCANTIVASSSKDPRVGALTETLKNYNQVSTDTAYRDALLSGKFYEQSSFLASEAIAKSAIARRPDYRIILKIGGYSEYALGNFKEASSLLERYYSLEPKDIETSYMLGIINYLKEDYATSNLYFNAAVLNGYQPKTELERRLIYNYTLLGDNRDAYKIFRYLLEESDVSSEDFEIAIFMAIEGGEPSKASIWSQKWLSRFPNDDRLLAFAGWLKRESGDLNEAETLLRRALSIDGRNPIASLELGRMFLAKKDYTLAEGYFQDAINADSGGFFAGEAQKELDTVTALLQSSMSSSGSTTASGNTSASWITTNSP